MALRDLDRLTIEPAGYDRRRMVPYAVVTAALIAVAYMIFATPFTAPNTKPSPSLTAPLPATK
jgi:hypothetical protein